MSVVMEKEWPLLWFGVEAAPEGKHVRVRHVPEEKKNLK
jgi:hypothetical protein